MRRARRSLAWGPICIRAGAVRSVSLSAPVAVAPAGGGRRGGSRAAHGPAVRSAEAYRRPGICMVAMAKKSDMLGNPYYEQVYNTFPWLACKQRVCRGEINHRGLSCPISSSVSSLSPANSVAVFCLVGSICWRRFANVLLGGRRQQRYLPIPCPDNKRVKPCENMCHLVTYTILWVVRVPSFLDHITIWVNAT